MTQSTKLFGMNSKDFDFYSVVFHSTGDLLQDYIKAVKDLFPALEKEDIHKFYEPNKFIQTPLIQNKKCCFIMFNYQTI